MDFWQQQRDGLAFFDEYFRADEPPIGLEDDEQWPPLCVYEDDWGDPPGHFTGPERLPALCVPEPAGGPQTEQAHQSCRHVFEICRPGCLACGGRKTDCPGYEEREMKP